MGRPYIRPICGEWPQCYCNCQKCRGERTKLTGEKKKHCWNHATGCHVDCERQ